MNLHEEQFIKNFIVASKRERYLSMFESRRARSKLIEGFYHLHDLDVDLATKVPSGEQSTKRIFQILKNKAAPDICYVISTNDKLDGKEAMLLNVLEEIVGTCDDGTFISCIPGKLGYYEGEDIDTRLILEKK